MDDYGPRIDGDRWHGGVDYNSNPNNQDDDRGDLIITIESGSIGGELSAGYKRLFVDGTHDFGYGHLFWGNQNRTKSGGCYLKQMIAPNLDDYAIIIIADSDTLVIGPQAGDVIFKGDTLTVQDSIMAGQPIGPTGGSSSGGELGPHLHLYSNPNGSTAIHDSITKNPLQYVEYADTTIDVQILKQDDVIPGITLEYPGDYENTIQVRPVFDGMPTGVKRYPAILDVDEVKIYISHESNDFELIEGPNYESRLCLGGRLGGPDRYPRKTTNFYNTATQWSRTGIHPYAYRGDGNADPWDDYYYADFVTRIHKDDPMNGNAIIANCPENSRYPDGEYELFVKVKNVRGDSTSRDTLQFNLDNFKPYIKEVRVETADDEHTIYHGYWSCFNNDFIFFSDCGSEYQATTELLMSGMEVYIEKTSEPLDSVLMSVPAYNISNRTPEYVNLDSTRFKFRIHQAEIDLDKSEVAFHFTGKDNNNNELISFGPEHIASNIFIPTRDSNNSWNDSNNPTLSYGIDSKHRFGIVCGDGGPPGGDRNELDARTTLNVCNFVTILGEEIYLDANISNTFNIWCDDGKIELEVNGGFPPYEFEWSNGATTQDIDHLAMGKYCLTVTDNLCNERFQCFTVGTYNSHVDVVWVENIKECDDGVFGDSYGSIDIEVLPYSGLLSYDWEYSEDQNWQSNNEDLYNLNSGMYKVTVTNENGCTIESDWITICCCKFRKTEGDFPCFDNGETSNYSLSGEAFPVSNSNGNNGSIDLTVTGNGNFYYSWTGANEFNANTEDVFGLEVGEYCVNVTNGCETKNKCFEIVDCSSTNLKIAFYYLVHTCKDYNVGKINVHGDYGVPPYKYKWSNGATSNFNTELGVGTYTVTVTDNAGCKKIKSYTIKENDITREATNYPECGWNYYCNGTNFLYFEKEKWACYHDDHTDCRVVNCYCLSTGKHMDTWKEDYVDIKFDYRNCEKLGQCPYDEFYNPHSENMQLIESGKNLSGEYRWILTQSSAKFKRYDCVYVTLGCEFKEDGIIIKDYIFVDKENCNGEPQTVDEPGIFLIDANDNIIDLKELKIGESFSEKIWYREDVVIENRQEHEVIDDIHIKIIPNPFSDKLNIELSFEPIGILEIGIYNVLGEKVYWDKYQNIENNKKIIIDTDYLSDGVYFIKIVHNNVNVKTAKIVKQR